MRKRKILIALPCLIPAGGINVITVMVKTLQKLNYQVDIISKEDGYMRQIFLQQGAEVRIVTNIMEESFIAWIVENYDEVLINTLQMCTLVYKLNGKDIEVKWWIHEPPVFFQQLSQIVPQKFWDNLCDNIKILAAGNLVHEYILETYKKENKVLNFGVEDFDSSEELSQKDLISPNKITYLLPSITFQPVKGQDIMAMAIEELSDEYKDKMEFIFIGSKLDQFMEYYDTIKLFEQNNKNVRVLDIIEKSELLTLMKQVDCIVAPSRQDSTNSCIVEGLMLSKVCLCSDGTGVSRYMKDCVNGFVFPNYNVDELKVRLMLIADNFSRLDVIAKNGRKVYEEVFSVQVFERNIRDYWIDGRNKIE